MLCILEHFSLLSILQRGTTFRTKHHLYMNYISGGDGVVQCLVPVLNIYSVVHFSFWSVFLIHSVLLLSPSHLNPQWTAGMFMLQLCRLSRCIMLNSKTQADAQVRARGWRKVHLTQIIMLRNNNRTYIKHWYQEQAVPEWQSCFFVCSPLVSSWFSSWLFFQILLSLQCPECTSFYMYLFI